MKKTSDDNMKDYANCGEAVESVAAVSVSSGQSILEAARMMTLYAIGCLPVVDQGHLTGIISERDIVAKIIAAGLDPSTATVDLAMTARPKTVDHSQPLADAFNLMNDYGFRHVPVMLNGSVLGVVSAKSLLRLLQEPRQNYKAKAT